MLPGATLVFISKPMPPYCTHKVSIAKTTSRILIIKLADCGPVQQWTWLNSAEDVVDGEVTRNVVCLSVCIKDCQHRIEVDDIWRNSRENHPITQL